MYRYLSIINYRTLHVAVISIVVTFLCDYFNFSYNLDIFVFGIAVIFPLVFTIREAFKRRDRALKFLSKFKASMNGLYYCFSNNNTLDKEQKEKAFDELNILSKIFMNNLINKGNEHKDVHGQLNQIFNFIKSNKKSISSNAAIKKFRLLADVQESIENIFALKMHGTPISLRAYCLIFIYIFPVVFTPSIVYDLSATSTSPVIVYILSILHGFILISLYNLQEDIENPFDHIGLDDIHLEEFQFEKI